MAQSLMGMGGRGGGVGNNKMVGAGPGPNPTTHALIDKIISTSRFVDKEQRLESCAELKQLLEKSSDSRDFAKDPFSVIYPLDEMFYGKVSSEVKRSVAVCLGHFGYIMSHKTKDFLVWLFENYRAAGTDEIQTLYLLSISTMLKREREKHTLETKNIVMIMSEVQRAFENADNAVVLLPLLDIVGIIGVSHSTVFEPHFKDAVDILAGWYVDTNTKAVVLEKSEEVMKQLQKFWMRHLDYTLDMLTTFLEDAEAYIYDSKSISTSSQNSPEECIQKTAALIRVSKTILESISTYFVVSSQEPRFVNFAQKGLERVEKCVEEVVGSPFDENGQVVSGVVEWMSVLLEVCRSEPDLVLGKWLRLVTQLCEAPGLEEEALIAVLSSIKKVIFQCEPDTVALYIDKFIGNEGILLPIRFHSNPSVVSAVVDCYRAMLTPKGITSLRESYKNVVGELESCFRILGNDDTFSLEIPNLPDFSSVVKAEKAEWIAIFHACALSQLGNAKNSLIGLWGLSPNLFQLLTERVSLASSWILNSSPSVHYSLLFTLKAHCENHDHFASSSELVIDSSRTPMLANAQTPHHLSIVLRLLISLLPLHTLSSHSRRLCLLWIQNIVKSVTSSVFFQASLCRRVVEDVISSVSNFSSELTANSEKECLKTFINIPGLTSQQWFWEKLIQCVLTLLNATGDEMYLKLLHKAPLVELARFDNSNTNSCLEEQSNIIAGRIGPQHFKLVIGFVLKNDSPSLLEQESNPFFHETLKMLLQESVPPRTKANLIQNANVLWDWALWGAAEICISSKLKTTLGKPADTFLRIENDIKSLASETVKGNSKRDGNDGSGHVGWTKVRLFLKFLEYLDKLMYNAFEGTATTLSVPENAVRTFFRTNRKTCEDWLSRIRAAVMTVALHNEYYEMVFRLGHQALFDLEYRNAPKTQQNSELIFPILAEALMRVGNEESLQGLYYWGKKILGSRLSWLKPTIDMAAERYETALKGYGSLTGGSESESNDETTSSPTLSTTELGFVRSQMVECFVRLKDWKSAKDWLSANNNPPLTDSPTYKHLTYYVDTLGSFELIPKTGLLDSDVTSSPPPNLLSWSSRVGRNDLECRIAQLLDPTTTDKEKLASQCVNELRKMESVQSVHQWKESVGLELQSLCRAADMIGTEEYSDEIFTVEGLVKLSEAKILLRQDVALTLGFWRKRIEGLSEKHKENSFAYDLGISRICRKRRNPNLSCALLQRHLRGSGGVESLYQSLLQSDHKLLEDWSAWLGLARHSAKLIFQEKREEEAFALLCKGVSRVLEGSVGGSVGSMLGVGGVLAEAVRGKLSVLSPGQSGMRMELARAMLRLGEWMQVNPSLGPLLLQEENTVFIKLVEERLSMAETHFGALDSGTVVLAILHLAALICPDLGKAQRALADWAYKAGMKAFEGSSKGEIVLLTEAEINLVHGCLPTNSSEAEKTALLSLVSSLQSDETGLSEASDFIRTLESTFSTVTNPDRLLRIWEYANRRLFLFYDFAGRAYFDYLRFTSDNCISSVTATLRLLRLLVKHVHYLDKNLLVEFENTDPKGWHCVMPQIFARLNHPSPVVREILSRLLERMGTQSPSLLVFPALIGSHSGRVPTAALPLARTLPEEEGDTDTVLDESVEDVSLMQSCCGRLMGVLEKVSPGLVKDVGTFSKELERIALLREEKWLSILPQLNHEVAKRWKQIQEESERTMKNNFFTEEEKEEIVREKTVVLLKLVFKILEDLFEYTTETPETPNEQCFVNQFQSTIKGYLTRYSENPASPKEAWEAFTGLLKVLENRASKRQSLNLDLKQLSPVLSAINGSDIPMPGREEEEGLRIHKILPRVSILSTKTRPKKLVFVGSDGKNYGYLFKGLEDLHLDERIMQFLRICNMMMTTKPGQKKYHARNYSVIPLGSRSGLIQWVEGATPIFSIYRRWQIRQSATSNNTPVSRPTELFYGKLAPALEKLGIKDLNNRQKWPLPVVKAVMAELISETPRDLLSKEMWCRSAGPEVWWNLTETFARSCAVMSVIGYVIGLGDRHLDNVLVDIHSGEVVHIDYNICFEKGRHLRVPETVPFRMTSNMQTPLGITGVEGTFRLSCENVLRVLRGGRETLMILLEAFVYDPLVDWTHEGDKHSPTSLDSGLSSFIASGVALTVYGTQKPEALRGSALEVSRRMFAVRRREISVPWMANKEMLGNSLRQLMESIVQSSILHEDMRKLVCSIEEEVAASGFTTNGDTIIPALNEEIETVLIKLQAKQTLYREQLSLLVDTVQTTCHEVKSALASHHRMMEIRIFIKAIAKLEKEGNQFERYLGIHKDFIEQLAYCLRLVGEKKELTEEDRKTLLNTLSLLIPSLDPICDGMLSLEDSNATVFPPTHKGLLPATGGVGKEKRNVQGMSIWRKVRLKLEGKDPDENNKANVTTQVEYMIREATSLENLSLMYEGWTAWV